MGSPAALSIMGHGLLIQRLNPVRWRALRHKKETGEGHSAAGRAVVAYGRCPAAVLMVWWWRYLDGSFQGGGGAWGNAARAFFLEIQNPKLRSGRIHTLARTVPTFRMF